MDTETCNLCDSSMKAKLQDTYGMAIKVYKFLRFGGMFTNGGIAGC